MTLEDETSDARSALEKALRHRAFAAKSSKNVLRRATQPAAMAQPVGIEKSKSEGFMPLGRKDSEVEDQQQEFEKLRSDLARAQARHRRKQWMLKRTIAKASRLAYLLAPEVAAYVPQIVDAQGRLRLLGHTSDDLDGEGGGSVSGFVNFHWSSLDE